MISCVLCAKNIFLFETSFDLHSNEGQELDIFKILTTIFPVLQINKKGRICYKCWNTVKNFHGFYQHILTVHKSLPLDDDDSDSLDFDVDPISNENPLKNLNNSLLSENNDFSAINEIKVEVNELELLPAIEVLENPVNSSEQKSPTPKQCEQQNFLGDSTNERIKFEESMSSEVVTQNIDNSDDDDIPLSDFMSLDFKTEDHNNDELIEPPISTDDTTTTTNNKIQKRKRGRPRKVKQTENETESESRKCEDSNKLSNNDISRSITNNDANDSDNSWRTEEEHFAEIPKRVAVKRKKYQKREKPLVTPVRLTREEIAKRNEQQREYDDIIAKFFNKFPCPLCNLLVQNFSDLRRHFRISHNTDSGYMSCCGRKFHLRKVLAEHVLVHWNPDHFKCSICKRIFQDSRTLEIHENAHKNPESKEKTTYQCDKCPKSFITKPAFEYHTLSKHVPKSEFKFSCKECNKKLPTKRKLRDHVKFLHDPESAIICDKCGKQVRTQTDLKRHHQLEHSDEPRPKPAPVQCEICGTWLRHLNGLKQHLKTIHEEAGGEYRCHICNKTSSNSRALKRHIYHNHECERKFKCTMCEKAFKRPQDLREHKSTHTGEALYTCPNCPMTFFSNANMYKHRQRLHRAEWEADRKKPNVNIMRQAVGATVATRLKQAAFAEKIDYFSRSTTGSIAVNKKTID